MAHFDFGQSPLPWEIQRQLETLLAAQGQNPNHPAGNATASSSSSQAHHQSYQGSGAGFTPSGAYREDDVFQNFMNGMGAGRDGHFGGGAGAMAGSNAGRVGGSQEDGSTTPAQRSSLQVPFFRWCEYMSLLQSSGCRLGRCGRVRSRPRMSSEREEENELNRSGLTGLCSLRAGTYQCTSPELMSISQLRQENVRMSSSVSPHEDDEGPC
jgi:hypothetical protein